MQRDYKVFIQRHLALSVGLASTLLSGITLFRRLVFFEDSLTAALLNIDVWVVLLVGLLFLVITIKPSIFGRAVQVILAMLVAFISAWGANVGDLTSTVFFAAAMMLALEYGVFGRSSRLLLSIPLVLYSVSLFTGVYRFAGSILASLHTLLGGGLAAYVFVTIIWSRLQQVRDRENELESRIADRTEGLRREVRRRAQLEIELRETAVNSQQLAAERTLLLHELHHRTKNDLQLIASMIRLHGEDDAGVTKHDLMSSAEDRIMAIALVHEYLYASEELSAIGLSEYLNGLISHLRSAHSGSAIRIEQHINTTVAVGIEPAIHVGLAINELVQNARKHAFPDGTSGSVTISALEIDDHLKLVVSDDGVGIQGPVPIEHSGSVGVEIVQGLVSQLGGEVAVESDEATTWTIVIPKANLSAKASDGNASAGPRLPAGEAPGVDVAELTDNRRLGAQD